MDKIQILDKTFKRYIPHEDILKSIAAVAVELNNDFKDSSDTPVLLCTLNGALMFTAELMKCLEMDCYLAAIKVSSYEGTVSTGVVHQVTGVTGDVKGRTVIICEDIVDTGTTIVALKGMLLKMGARDVRVCTMLLKPDVYDKDIKIDYVAIKIPNDFIVGFGLDYNGLGRQYKDIYVIDN